jgi:predicted Zn finger-like uncharacterized protein
MIVQCPNCAAKFNLPDEQFREGAKARCSLCKHVFELNADQEPSDRFADEEAVETQEEGGYEIPDDLASASAEDLTDGDGTDEDEDSGMDLGFDLDDDQKKKKKKSKKKGGKSKALLVVLALLLLLGGGAAALWLLAPQYIPFLELGGQEPQAETVSPEDIKNIALQNVRQYYVNNEKVGSLFVIEGKVVNNFQTAKELIKIRASLFDEQGVELDSKERLAGTTVSLFQLQMLSQDELETKLTNKVEILTNNTNIPPGGEVPFMAIFYNPPESVREFLVKVVEAKNPPEQ